MTFKNQLAGGVVLKYSIGPLLHNSELDICSGLSIFLLLRSAGKLELCKCEKYICILGALVTMALLTLMILVVRLRGAVLLWTLWGLSVLALHIESRNTFSSRVSGRDDNEGIALIYSSASFSP